MRYTVMALLFIVLWACGVDGEPETMETDSSATVTSPMCRATGTSCNGDPTYDGLDPSECCSQVCVAGLCVE